MRRKIFEQVGGFDVDLPVFELGDVGSNSSGHGWRSVVHTKTAYALSR